MAEYIKKQDALNAIRSIQKEAKRVRELTLLSAVWLAVDAVQSESTAQEKWISVKDRLPEDMPENKGKKVIPCFVALKSVYPNGKHTIQKRQRQIVSAYDKNGKRIKTWA